MRKRNEMTCFFSFLVNFSRRFSFFVAPVYSLVVSHLRENGIAETVFHAAGDT